MSAPQQIPVAYRSRSMCGREKGGDGAARDSEVRHDGGSTPAIQRGRADHRTGSGDRGKGVGERDPFPRPRGAQMLTRRRGLGAIKGLARSRATADSGKAPIFQLRPEDYRVVKRKFAKVKDPGTGKSVYDTSTVVDKPKRTIRHIPLEAYDYVVNGKPALEWVMERQSVTTDKASGIVNDAKLWATETMGDAKCPLELTLRVVTVSLETMKIVRGVPDLVVD